MRVLVARLFLAMAVAAGLAAAAGSDDVGSSSKFVHAGDATSSYELPSEVELYQAMERFDHRASPNVNEGPAEVPHGLPTDNHFEKAMTKRPLGKEQPQFQFHSNQEPWSLMTANNVKAGQAHHYITEFYRTADNKPFGPLAIGSSRFQTKNYPTNIPLLQHTYSHDYHLMPVNFEKLKEGRTLRPGEWIFRPDPLVLDEMTRMIHEELNKQQREPQLVKNANGILQGQPAWPPVDFDPNFSGRLDMPFSSITHQQSNVIHSIQVHGADMPRIYHFKVQTDNGVRDIMMTRANPLHHTDLRAVKHKSDYFWLLHEAMQGEGRPHPSYALLGGMFLPRDAPDMLQEHMSLMR